MTDKKAAEQDVIEPASEDVPAADAPTEKGPSDSEGASHWDRFKNWYVGRKKWTIPASVLLFILILAGIPFTRYNLAGLVLKQDFSVRVTDSATNTPVSGAQVSAGAVSGETDGTGKVTLHRIKVGNHVVLFTKKYYKDSTANLLVPILKQKGTPQIHLSATGRQVKITVTNLINKKVLSDVDIKVADITAKTDKSGSAVVVLPVGSAEQKATLSLDGYNDASVSVKISNDKIQDNPFSLTPSGKVYFLSKLSGKIDVVKTNLDGTARQTVLAGTGSEDDQNTVLLASKDWKYLALLSRRAGSSASLYLLDTSNDSLTTIDEGSATFDLLGWSDDYFSYVINRQNVQNWQPKAQSIKSYNAQTKQLLSLDSTNATGTSNADANYETYIIKPILLDNMIVYAKTWYRYPGYLDVSAQNNTLNTIRPDGTGKKQVKSLDSSQAYFGSMVFHTPTSVYVQISQESSGADTYYELNGSGTLTQKNSLTSDDIFKTYPSYLFSPDDKSTFWAESRDGKNTLFIGDDNGSNGKQVATLSEYSPYGWYTGNYLLVSKNSSELYIMSNDGSQPAIKISDYHKPALSFAGYGGGYGGL